MLRPALAFANVNAVASPRTPDRPCERQGRDLARAPRPERLRAGVERRTGRVDVVHEHDEGRDRRPPGGAGTNAHRARRTREPGTALEADLGAARGIAAKDVGHAQAGRVADRPRQLGRLVEAVPAPAEGM